MILKSLVQYFTGHFNELINTELRVIKLNGELLTSDEAMKEWGVIYYSSLPYTPKFQVSNNLIDASPKRRSTSLLNEIVKNRERIEKFGFFPNLRMTTEFSFNKVLLKIVRLCFNARSSIGVIFPNDPNFLMLHELYNSSTSKEITQSQIFATKCIPHLEQHILSLPKQELILATLVIINRIASIRGATDEVINLCNRVLKIPYEYSREGRGVFRYLRDIFGVRRIIKNSSINNSISKDNETSLTITKEIVGKYQIHPDLRKVADIYFELHFDGMSSGQIAILLQFCNITAALEKISSKRDNILLLIDEGDAFLHLEWQRLYIQQLNDLLSGTVQSAGVSALQVIMATHSPLLATDVPKQFVCSLNEQQDGKTPKAFAATLHTLFNQSFKAKTIGEFASQRINEAVENYRNKNPDARDEAVIKSIDNPIIGEEIHRLLNDKESVN
ncbi:MULTISPECIES: AAA family ATPase [unclassified Pseudomonas]|nr:MULTISPECIES: AAA family ATPase [unclassified Pseudomonas]